MLDKLNCIILCGGRGSRMGPAGTHKVCFDIDGTPAINRAVENYRKAGIGKFLLVVGHMCGQVIETVGSVYPDTMFVYQPDPRGTGHAARIGVEALKNAGVQGPVMVTMGDKIVRPELVGRLAAEFDRGGGAAAFVTAPKHHSASAGRVIVRDGITAIREAADIRKATGGGVVRVGAAELDPAEAERLADCVNCSVYIFRQDLLCDALARLDSENAQGEEYLTDVIEIISARSTVSAVQVSDRHEVMSFNNPEELLVIRDYYRRAGRAEPHPDEQAVKDVRRWLRLFETPPPGFRRRLADIYGDDARFLAERCDRIVELLELFARHYGPERKAVVARSPGRINLMGRHIDHRGGNVNVMSINREVTVAASARDDDRIRIVNTDRRFAPHEFSISEHLEGISWESWLRYVNSRKVRAIVRQEGGGWQNYVKAAALRLQHMLPDRKLKGMDMAVSGDIPLAAGLSSSSAVVVAAAEAMIALNGLDVPPEKFVDLCGEGEWFVGSRGGCADHAAMKFAARGQVVSMSLLPMRIAAKNPFPNNCRLLIADSGVKAEKSASARNQFNHRIACYELGMLLLKRSCRVERLRDMTPENLGVPLETIYKSLLDVPLQVGRDKIYESFPPETHAEIERIMQTHSHGEPYHVRPVILFGMSECERARLCVELLEKGDSAGLGRFMKTSHEGDRVVGKVRGRYVKNRFRAGDRYIRDLIRNVRSRRARLQWQHGAYLCSTPEIDFIVDAACSLPGVAGAQLSGAGLGGCAMILAEQDAVPAVKEALAKQYYEPRGMKPAIEVCRPVEGSGVFCV